MNKDKDIINMDNGVGTAAADCSNRDRLLAKVLDAACAKIKMWRVVICKDDGTLLEDRHEIISALEDAHYVNPVAKDYTNTMESVAVTARWQDDSIGFLPRSIICVEEPSIVGSQATICAMNFYIETNPDSEKYREQDVMMGLIQLRELEEKEIGRMSHGLTGKDAIIRMFTVDTSNGDANIMMQTVPIQVKDYLAKVFPYPQQREMESISVTWGMQDTWWLPIHIAIGRGEDDGLSFLVYQAEKENEVDDEDECENDYNDEDDCGDEEYDEE